jgi:hypothetical protein
VQPIATGDNIHWQNGVTWESRCLSPMGNTTYDECIVVTGAGEAPPQPNAKTDVVNLTLRGSTPFTPFAKFDCSPVGNGDAAKIANDALTQSEPWQIERAFWTGAADGKTVVFPHLAANATVVDAQSIQLQSPASIVVTGAAVDIVTGLGLLEAALADCYNGVGVIHVPVKVLPTLDAWGLVKAYNGILKTLNGNLVAAGAGYPGTSPAGAAPATGESWIYATGAVTMRRGDIKTFTLSESINRGNNTIEMIAERTYVLGWDCCHFAILVDIGVPIV